MPTIVPIVEGHGDVEAVRTLVNRIAEDSSSIYVNVGQPIRAPRKLVVKAGELEKRIRLAAGKGGPDGRILVLLDADDDCPAELGPRLLARAQAAHGDRKIAVVLAKIEYEAWFAAAADSLAWPEGLKSNVTPPDDPESLGSPKRWISERMVARRYSPTRHQAKFTARLDLTKARRAPSFDKMWRSVADLLR